MLYKVHNDTAQRHEPMIARLCESGRRTYTTLMTKVWAHAYESKEPDSRLSLLVFPESDVI